eukprot:3975269-Pyramimonas_sp.AAC.1
MRGHGLARLALEGPGACPHRRSDPIRSDHASPPPPLPFRLIPRRRSPRRGPSISVPVLFAVLDNVGRFFVPANDTFTLHDRAILSRRLCRL